jgi:hypothetical protein
MAQTRDETPPRHLSKRPRVTIVGRHLEGPRHKRQHDVDHLGHRELCYCGSWEDRPLVDLVDDNLELRLVTHSQGLPGRSPLAEGSHDQGVGACHDDHLVGHLSDRRLTRRNVSTGINDDEREFHAQQVKNGVDRLWGDVVRLTHVDWGQHDVDTALVLDDGVPHSVRR